MAMSDERRFPVRIALVGHTNTGKTSLMRTLTRDGRFGEVSSRPSTTRHVEGARLIADNEALIELYDTPGMEDPVALLERIDTLVEAERQSGEILDGPAGIARFLTLPEAEGRFEQEAKVLRQLLASDAGLYVVDARDPVLAKHRDELALLGRCARPLLPVLNFVRDPEADEVSWREALARLGLHAVIRFDTVAPERDAERLLYGKLATLLDACRSAFERLIASRERETIARRGAGEHLIAEMLIEVAACRLRVEGEAAEIAAAVDGMNQRVRVREQACVDALLGLYRFDRDDVETGDLPLIEGRWEDDLFNPETLRSMRVKLGGGAAAGAAAGLGLDLMVGGLSLGVATAIGALAGGGWQTLRHYGDRLRGKLAGHHELTVDDAILRLLALRALELLRALEARGHAAMTPFVQAPAMSASWREGALPRSIESARAHPEWSGLFGAMVREPEREQAVSALADELGRFGSADR